jgi:hypothetical protein
MFYHQLNFEYFIKKIVTYEYLFYFRTVISTIENSDPLEYQTE